MTGGIFGRLSGVNVEQLPLSAAEVMTASVRAASEPWGGQEWEEFLSDTLPLGTEVANPPKQGVYDKPR